MRTGAYISGGAHTGLFLWLLIGGFFVSRDLPEITVADISIISTEEFEALQPSGPQTSDAPVTPERPEPDDAPAVVPEETVVPAPRPAAPTQLAPPPSEETADETAEPVVTPQPDVNILGDPGGLVVGDDDNAVPEAAPLITDEVTPTPEENVARDEVAQEETAPDEVAESVEEIRDTTAPEATTTDIVTEAEEQPSSAPTVSKRPGRKPTPPAPQRAEPAPEATETDPIADALREALGTPETTPQQPNVADSANVPQSNGANGPPLTRSELSGFRLGIQKCWNVGALGTDALRVTVIVAFTMNRDGKPQTGSVRMIGAQGGSGDSVDRAYEAARRAIIRCGSSGFELPAEKYDQWQEVEVTFNASQKQIR